MTRTHAYLSALITCTYPEKKSRLSGSVTLVKAHTWSTQRGWHGDRKLKLCLTDDRRATSLVQIKDTRSSLRDYACEFADEVPLEAYRLFGRLAELVAFLHGEQYPTWVGDLYVLPSKPVRGCPWTSRFLITEAPGLDCGIWEGDLSPLRGE